MNINNGIKKICESIGKDNNPAYAVVSIAAAKGIFRPLFTMMDKKESPETKKYTAIREGLTEVIAIPTYLACGALAGKSADFIKDAELAKRAKHNLRFIGVCSAALVIIPGLCSLVVKPFTDKIFKNNDNSKSDASRLDVTSVAPKVESSNVNFGKINKIQTLHTYDNKVSMASFTNHGMRVG